MQETRQETRSVTALPLLGLFLVVPGLAGCNTYAGNPTGAGSILTAKPVVVSEEERDCLGRAMYFESNRSDAEGLLAVGTVVMNRLEAAAFPNGGICSVVGQPRQFAPGVLTRKMEGKELQKVAEVADAVLDGQRHPKLGRTMHFHTAGLRFPYNNMHYVAVAGGNAFYEKRKPGAVEQPTPPTALAFAPAEPPRIPVIPATAPVPVPAPAAVAAAAPMPAASQAPVPARPATQTRLAHAERKPAREIQPRDVHHAAQARAPRSRVAMTPAAMAPAPLIAPTVLNLPRP